MKKNMKKIISFMLTLTMILAMSITTFAANATLTINGAEGHTYKVYQMLVGDVSGLTKGEGTLANVTAGANLKTSTTVDAFVEAVKGKEGTELAAVAKDEIADINSPFATYGATALTVAEGYYVVIDNYTDDGKECAAYMVAVVGPTTMNPKTSIPDIDKNITDDDANEALETGDSKKTDTAAIGDRINYKTESEVPVTEGYKYYIYNVSDTMSEGLTYQKDLVITIGSKTLVKDTDYTIDETDRGFELVVKNFKQYTAGDAIEITYSAIVNENASLGQIPNTNTTHLTYSNNPDSTFDKVPHDVPNKDDVVGVTPDRVTKTYVTQVSIQKTDADKEAWDTALAGATFKLTGTGLNDVKVLTETVFEVAENGEYYKLKDGTYTKTAPNDNTKDKYDSVTVKYNTVTKVSLTDAESGDELNITAVVDANGQITFTGLNAGTYTIEETKVPEGYNKCADINFTITATQTGATDLVGGDITWTSNNEKVQPGQTAGVFETTIENKKGSVLPSIGGMGTRLFYIIGGVLVLGAGILLITKRRVNN